MPQLFQEDLLWNDELSRFARRPSIMKIKYIVSVNGLAAFKAVFNWQWRCRQKTVVNLKIDLSFKTYQKPHHALVFQNKNVNLSVHVLGRVILLLWIAEPSEYLNESIYPIWSLKSHYLCSTFTESLTHPKTKAAWFIQKPWVRALSFSEQKCSNPQKRCYHVLIEQYCRLRKLILKAQNCIHSYFSELVCTPQRV